MSADELRLGRPTQLQPFRVKHLAAGFIDPLEGMGPEIVTLGLQEVGWRVIAAVTIVIGQGGGKGGDGNSQIHGGGNDMPP